MTTLLPCTSHTRFYLTLAATLFAITVAGAPRAEELGHLRYHDSDYRALEATRHQHFMLFGP